MPSPRFQFCCLAALVAAAAGYGTPPREEGNGSSHPNAGCEPAINLWTNIQHQSAADVSAPRQNTDAPLYSFPATANRSLSHAAAPGGAATITVASTIADDGAGYQWFKDVHPIPGATDSTLVLPAISSEDAGVYDVLVSASNESLSRPVVLGISLPEGVHSAGSVTVACDNQDRTDRSCPNTDDYLLTGTAGTISAVPGQVARLAFFAAGGQVVQVEISGAGSLTVVLDHAADNKAGQPEATISRATVVLCDFDTNTRFTISSAEAVGENRITWQSANYASWAEVVLASASNTQDETVVVRDISTGNSTVPELYFDSAGSIAVRLDSASPAPYVNQHKIDRDQPASAPSDSMRHIASLPCR